MQDNRMTDNEKNKQTFVNEWKELIKNDDISLFQILKFNHFRKNKGIIHDLAFIWKVLAHPKTYRRFINLLRRPCCESAAITDVSIMYKILRPYETSDLTSSERVSVLENHYNLLSEFFTIKQFNTLGTNQGLNIINYPQTESYPGDVTVSLQYNGTHRREGELTVAILKTIYDEGKQHYSKGRIFSIAMNFGYVNNEKAIKINSIQGCAHYFKEPQKEISSVTKQGYGILPKYLMLEIAFKIAEIMGIKHVLGIKKASHVYSNAHYKARVSSDEFRYDYDKQWAEFGGKEYSPNYYELFPIKRTPIEEVPSKKRSQHRKRYAFLDEIKLNLEKLFVKQQ